MDESFSKRSYCNKHYCCRFAHAVNAELLDFCAKYSLCYAHNFYNLIFIGRSRWCENAYVLVI